MTLAELLHRGPVAVAFLAMAAMAVAVLVVVGARSSQLGLREEEFVVQINKLIHARNVERAAKLCQAGNGRLVALLVGVGVDVLLRSELRPEDAIERAKAAMADRLPLMLRALMPGVIAAAAVACLSTALGAVLLAQITRAAPLVIGILAPLDAVAAWAILARLRLRRDLLRSLSDFGSFERSSRS